MRSNILSDTAIFKIIWRFMIISRWIFRTLTCVRENDSSTKQQAAPCCESLWKRTLSAKPERLAGSRMWLPQILGCGEYPILESFFGSPVSALNGQAMIFLWSGRSAAPLEACVKPLWFAGSTSQWGLAQDSPRGQIAIVLQGENRVGGAISQCLLSSCIILIGW